MNFIRVENKSVNLSKVTQIIADDDLDRGRTIRFITVDGSLVDIPFEDKIDKLKALDDLKAKLVNSLSEVPFYEFSKDIYINLNKIISIEIEYYHNEPWIHILLDSKYHNKELFKFDKDIYKTNCESDWLDMIEGNLFNV